MLRTITMSVNQWVNVRAGVGFALTLLGLYLISVGGSVNSLTGIVVLAAGIGIVAKLIS